MRQASFSLVRSGVAAALCTLLCLPLWRAPAAPVAGCAPRLEAPVRLPYRVDELLVGRRVSLALVGSPARQGAVVATRFLPHDSLLVLDARSSRRDRIIPLPSYGTPPGLASTADGRTVYVAINRSIDVLDPGRERISARLPLDMQTLGWPAALTVDVGNRLYLAGQRYDSALPTAMVEALQVRGSAPPGLLWRSRLGVTHAGIWVGLAGPHMLAVYLPDASDAEGTVEILDTRPTTPPGGRLQASYAVNGPPSAADEARDRLYVEGGEQVRALALRSGAPVALTAGRGPVTAVPQHGLVAFTRHSGRRTTVVLASARALQTVATVTLPVGPPDVRALASAPEIGRAHV